MVTRGTTSFNIKRVHDLRTAFDYVFPCVLVPVPSFGRRAISFNWILFFACITFILSVSSAHCLYRHAKHLSWIFCPTCISFLPCVISAPSLNRLATQFKWTLCSECSKNETLPQLIYQDFIIGVSSTFHQSFCQQTRKSVSRLTWLVRESTCHLSADVIGQADNPTLYPTEINTSSRLKT